MNCENILEFDPIVLAFLGDGIHTLFVREHLCKTAGKNAGKLHLEASKYCKAQCQARVLDNIFDLLTEDEKDIVRRARNHKLTHSPKNADIEEYKKATGFEALIGYLYKTNKKERMAQFLEKSLEVIK